MTESTGTHAADESVDLDEPGSAPHAEPAAEIEYVHIYPEAGKQSETAKALLDAAERPEDVQYSGEGYFSVPAELADKAEAALPKGADEVSPGDSPAGTDDNADGEVDEVEAMSNDELRAALADAKQPTSGNKSELQARLREYRTAQEEPTQ
jgi:hypothetical protein